MKNQLTNINDFVVKFRDIIEEGADLDCDKMCCDKCPLGSTVEKLGNRDICGIILKLNDFYGRN